MPDGFNELRIDNNESTFPMLVHGHPERINEVALNPVVHVDTDREFGVKLLQRFNQLSNFHGIS